MFALADRRDQVDPGTVCDGILDMAPGSLAAAITEVVEAHSVVPIRIFGVIGAVDAKRPFAVSVRSGGVALAEPMHIARALLVGEEQLAVVSQRGALWAHPHRDRQEAGGVDTEIVIVG